MKKYLKWSPLLLLALFLPLHPASASIAYDNTGQIGINPGLSGTLAFAPIGTSNLIAVITINVGNNDDLKDITVGGVSIFTTNQITKVLNTNSATELYVYYYYLGSDNSSKNYAVSTNGSDFTEMHIYSYTGVKQSAQPDAFQSSFPNVNQTTFTMNITPVAANSWGYSFVEIGGGVAPTASTNVNTRDATINGEAYGDTNADKSAAFDQTWTFTSTKFAGIQFTLAPAAGGGGGYSHAVNGVSAPSKVNGVTPTKVNGL